MTLPAEVQTHVDQIRALLGVPPCKLVIDMDDAGNVQLLQPTPNYRPARMQLKPDPTALKIHGWKDEYGPVDKLTKKSAP